ncbi:glycine cleavage system protein GcvH [Deinococcus humi]|uniref:Glycine cleavage system H protein n=1 Tax=Deinococcus humi TaxID=662880 RepID=A0A7W8JWT7_9DEIO|nr:glycine cleavage system protein GcvH [Deinococcus humi]MBB5364692.1 glycine cleavage system H protein [Deinococcus humi]GGO34272.1 glycine cleavage system H protein [Deinococcus humi]
MNTPSELKYAASHEWLSEDGTVGISDFAQDQLGDVVYVELPEVGREVMAGDTVAVVESVKTASDIYAPASGTITAVNDELSGSPELVNSSPYESGWLFKLDVTEERSDLMDAATYTETAEG